MSTCKKKIIFILLFAITAILSTVVLCSVTQTTYAATTEVRYLTQGKVEYEVYKNNNISSGEKSYAGNYDDIFSVYLCGESSLKPRNDYYAFSNVKIIAEVMGANPHGVFGFEPTNFKLTRNDTNEIIVDNDIYKKNNLILFEGSLVDGEYTLEYKIIGETTNMADPWSYTSDIYLYTFNIDETKPTTTLTAGSSQAQSGDYTNQSIIFTAQDKNFDLLYYKSPSMSKFMSTSVSTYSVTASTYNNGLWSFYASDFVGNVSETVNIYLDTDKPVGTIKSYNDNTVLSSTYVNYRIKYDATDNIGVMRCEYKIPENDKWIKYTADTLVGTTPGWYYFRAVDFANNVSEEQRIFYDSNVPTGKVYADNTTVTSGNAVNAAFIKYEALDAESGLKKCFVKEPGQSAFKEYTNGSQLKKEGTYYFRCEDFALNVSETISITLDVTKPIGTLFAGSEKVNSGSQVNSQSISFSAIDTISGIKEYFVKKPNTKEFVSYSENEQLNEEGSYVFLVKDLADNLSDDYEILLDKTAPIGILKADNMEVQSGTITNASMISFLATDNLSGVAAVYVKLPGASSFKEFTENIKLTEDGEYSFFCKDKSKNESQVITVVWDRIAPECNIYAGENLVLSDTVVNAAYVKFTASDKISGLANIYVLMPGDTNFIKYTAGTQLTTEGEYRFFAEDFGNNRSQEFVLTLDRTAPSGFVFGESMPLKDGAYTNVKFISYLPSDNLGIKTVYVKMPGSQNFVEFSKDTQFTVEGIYYFRCEDFALNVSETISAILDRTPCVNVLYANNTIVKNGTKTNAAYVKLTATDAISGVAKCYVQIPGTTGFIEYIQATQLTAEGVYLFYSVDICSNKSEILSITLDRTAPIGILYAEKTTIENDDYTSASYIKFTATDELSGVECLFVKMPGDSNFIIYSESSILSAQGVYIFYAIDASKNASKLYTVTIDREKPNGILFAGNTQVESGIITSAAFVTYKANDNFDIFGLFVKLPGNNQFEKFESGTKFTFEGDIYFYAVDMANNQSETVKITHDITIPIGQLYNANGVISNQTKTNVASLYFVATDTISGIKHIFVKLPSRTDFVEYVNRQKFDESGYYEFQAVDFAGLYSEVYKVLLDTDNPIGQIESINGIITSNSAINVPFITFTAMDVTSGIADLYIKLPNTEKFVVYQLGTKITTEGITRFYAEDITGNKSIIYSVTIDRTNPIGYLSISNSHTNESFSFTAVDDITNIIHCEVKKPGKDWSNYLSGTIISNTSANGIYLFRAYDEANNVSDEYSICLDTVKPIGQIFADDTSMKSGNYTNAESIYFSVSDNNLASCYVLMPGSSEWKIYPCEAIYASAGKYEFFAFDLAFNRSETYTITIDRTPKELTLNGVINGFSQDNVSIAWTNGNSNIFAPILYVTVNGKECSTGSEIDTITNAKYIIQSVDAAGNVWETEFISKRVNILTKTTNKEWWEACDKTGKFFAFEKYSNAFEFATLRELGYVRIGEWTNPNEWDIGIMMDGIDSANAKLGKFFIYKKSGDASVEVAYFTEQRLNAVISEFAEIDIRHFYYYDTAPSTPAENNDIYRLNSEGIILSDRIELTANAYYIIDGKPFNGQFYDIHGKHNVIVKDDFGNQNSYIFIVIRELPQILMAVGDGEFATANTAQTYYLKNSVTLKMADNLDEYSLFYILNEKGDTLAILGLDDEFKIETSGKYVVRAVNHFGNSNDINVFISLSPPTVSFEKDNTKKQLNITINSSLDAYATLQSIQIFKSTDNEKTWILLTKDDYDNGVATSVLTYKFRTSGIFRIIIEDTFHTGFEALEEQFEYCQPAPEGTLKGVENNGFTNSQVSFVWKDEAVVVLKKNGQEITYLSGNKIAENGDYELIFANFDGYKETYSFVIDTIAPEIEINGCKSGEIINTDISVSWSEDNLEVSLFINDKLVGAYEKNTLLTDSALYKIIAIDRAGNETELVFTTDKIVDFNADLYDFAIVNEITFKANETLEIVLTSNKEQITYEFGDTLKTPGIYTAILTDQLGNYITLHFAIPKPFSQKYALDFTNVKNLEKLIVNDEEYELSDSVLQLVNSGTYYVMVTVSNKDYSFIVTVDNDAPIAVLNGVENGATTKGEVTITNPSEEAVVKAYIDEVEFTYNYGDKLSEIGHYRVVLTDACGNKTIYEFDIIYALNTGAIVLIVIALALIIGGLLAFIIVRKKGRFGKKKNLKKVSDDTSESETE